MLPGHAGGEGEAIKHFFVDGDVVWYLPEQSHCREGLAVCEKGALLDTYWGTGDRHHLTNLELQNAQFVFNTSDFTECKSKFLWERYAENDRAEITSQHGLQRRYFIRNGASEDLNTKIANAERNLQAAKSQLIIAQGNVENRTQELEVLRQEIPGYHS